MSLVPRTRGGMGLGVGWWFDKIPIDASMGNTDKCVCLMSMKPLNQLLLFFSEQAASLVLIHDMFRRRYCLR